MEAWPLHDATGRIPTRSPFSPKLGESGLAGSSPSSLLPPSGLENPGTVGVFTGMTGVLMGIGPVPMAPLRMEGLVEGVRRIVATPGVTITGPGVEGRPAVEAGRLA